MSSIKGRVSWSSVVFWEGYPMESMWFFSLGLDLFGNMATPPVLEAILRVMLV